MRKLVPILLLVLFAGSLLAPIAEARRVRVVHRGARTRVVVVHGHPIRRAMPLVVVRAPRRAVVVRPAVFLAPVVFVATVVSLPDRDRLVWEDSEKLDKGDDWTDFTLNVESRGERLYLEVDGRVQIEYAEVVFDNGEARVVDFNRATRGSGTFLLLDFADGRRVDHVQMIARAKTDEARITVRMAK